MKEIEKSFKNWGSIRNIKEYSQLNGVGWHSNNDVMEDNIEYVLNTVLYHRRIGDIEFFYRYWIEQYPNYAEALKE